MPAEDDWAAPFLHAPHRSGIFTDFDGVLAHIIADPAGVEPLPGVRAVLEALAERYVTVAVVSGRPVSFLATHLRGAGVRLVGQYGLEWVDGDRTGTHTTAATWAGAVADAARAARVEMPEGLFVEAKSASLTLHYREHPALARVVQEWAQGYSERSGLEVRPGKMAVEMHPPVEISKGTVVLDAAAGLEAVMFLGDDVGDLPAFAALDHLALSGIHTVKVAVASAEAPPQLTAGADIVVDGPGHVVDLLSQLLS